MYTVMYRFMTSGRYVLGVLILTIPVQMVLDLNSLVKLS